MPIRPLRRIRRLTNNDRQTLAGAAIATDEQFWKGISEDENFLDALTLTNEAKTRIVSAMSKLAIVRSRSIMKSGVRSVFYNILLLVVLALPLLVIYRVYETSGVVPPAHVVVTNPNGLAPFQLISKGDIGISCERKDSSQSHLIDDFVGRYAKKFVARCSVLEPSLLSDGKLASTDYSQRQILTLDIQPAPVVSGMRPPFEVGLLAAPRGNSPKSIFIAKVYVLDMQVESNDVHATISIAAPELDALMAFSARGDYFFVGPAH